MTAEMKTNSQVRKHARVLSANQTRRNTLSNEKAQTRAR